jgi:TonB family protein
MPSVLFATRPNPRGEAGVARAIDAGADRPARGNIISIRRTGDAYSSDQAPILRLGEGDRPAPPRSHDDARFGLALILCGSLIGHAALFAFLRTEPEMTASVGEDAITVEIIVGANSAAGTAQARSDIEAEQQSAMDVRQDENAQEKSIKEEPKPQPEAAMTPAEEPITPVRKEVAPPERNVEQTPEPKPLELLPSKPTRSTATAPANSIGRGRMVAGDVNYQGLVAARLARFKRFPAEARRRREHGSALVSFVIDGTGRVTSVRLVRGTGFVALDDEVQAMVRRASPFPSPPRGGEMTFAVPVSFHLK